MPEGTPGFEDRNAEDSQTQKQNAWRFWNACAASGSRASRDAFEGADTALKLEPHGIQRDRCAP